MISHAGHFLYKIQKYPGIAGHSIRAILTFASYFYHLVTKARQMAFSLGILKIQKMDVPVVSLGNITTGGTGKTPACIWLIKKLLEKNTRLPVLISRGYGNDEVFLLRGALPETPHLVHKKRVVAASQAIEKYGRNICLVLDDAFQHQYIHRDLNIVLLDATEPFGFGYTLPRGFLRESLYNLKRADFILFTKSDMVEKEDLEKMRDRVRTYTKAPQAMATHAFSSVHPLGKQETASIDTLQEKRLLAFSGIGNPRSFIQSMEKKHLFPIEHIAYPDHHKYTEKDQQEILSMAYNRKAEALITTAKDAVKLNGWQNSNLPIWVWEIAFCIQEGEGELVKKMEECLATYN